MADNDITYICLCETYARTHSTPYVSRIKDVCVYISKIQDSSNVDSIARKRFLLLVPDR